MQSAAKLKSGMSWHTGGGFRAENHRSSLFFRQLKSTFSKLKLFPILFWIDTVLLGNSHRKLFCSSARDCRFQRWVKHPTPEECIPIQSILNKTHIRIPPKKVSQIDRQTFEIKKWSSRKLEIHTSVVEFQFWDVEAVTACAKIVILSAIAFRGPRKYVDLSNIVFVVFVIDVQLIRVSLRSVKALFRGPSDRNRTQDQYRQLFLKHNFAGLSVGSTAMYSKAETKT